MADDDYARAQELINQINALRYENAQLEAELEMAERNVEVLTGNVGVLEANVHSTMSQLSSKVEVTAEDVNIFFMALRDLTEQYFLFKNLSTASKNLTMYTDEYYTKFSFYNKLRRITLGYVIGLDNTIISSETLRLEVEKAYLQNTDYWLAYAIMAVMLWSKNEREAANRAMNKALSMDYFRSCVQRVKDCRQWTRAQLDALGMTTIDSDTNFVFTKHPGVPGKVFYTKLREKGILIRHFDTPRLTDYIRVTIGDEQQMAAFITAVKEILEETL